MKRTVVLFLSFLLCSVASANPIQLQGDILMVSPVGDEATNPSSLWQPKIWGGDFEWHSREGYPNYRGVPLSLRVFLSENGEVRVVFWIDKNDTFLDEDDELLFDERFDALKLRPKTYDLYEFEDGVTLALNLMPSLIKKIPSEAVLTADEMGLNYLCLRHASAVIDDVFHFGSFSGFGEYLDIGVPGLALARMSLIERDGWEAIGIYKDGVIEVMLPNNHVLNVHGVRYGPAGFDKGGPFTVFGFIKDPEYTVEQAREFTNEDLERRFKGEVLAVVKEAAKRNPYGGNGRVSIGSTKDNSEHLDFVKGGRRGEGIPACRW